MGAGHNHHHGHDHSHGLTAGADSKGMRTRLAIAFGITFLIVIAQAVGAILTGSLALLTDTAHAITDASGLLVALIAANLMHRPPSSRRTWGFRRIEVIAALGQATLLFVVGSYAAVEGVSRLITPPEVPATELLVIGIFGLLANLCAMLVLSSARSANFNMRAAFLEVLNDALGSVGVIVAAVVIAATDFYQADAIAALFIAFLILPRAYRLIRETVAVLMEFTPEGLDLEEVREHILSLDHVLDVHDMHASTVATGLPRLTAHVTVADECFTDGHAAEILVKVRECVAKHFEVSIKHSTFQIETQAIASHDPCEVDHG